MSVVIPAYNAEETIQAALVSVGAQTVAPHEVVVVDDGSSDRTPAVVRGYGPGVRLLHQDRQGPSAARNAGIAATSGDLVAFLDADDEWHPEKLERQLRVLDDGAVVVATDWTRGPFAAVLPDQVPVSTVPGTDLLLLNRFQTSTVLARRSALDATGGFDTTLDGVEDWDMWLRMSEVGQVRKLDWPLVRYRDSPVGVSKALDRVYATGAVMLGRRFGARPARQERTILAWHHLRFAAAFALIGDRAHAAQCVRASLAPGVRAAVPEAAVRYLVPFLFDRVRRRIPGSRHG